MNFDPMTDRQKSHLASAREIALAGPFQVWLVGGPVRDLLLQRPVGDLDFVLEENVERFTALFAERVGGILRSFPRFGTFKIDLPEGDAIDVTAARAETYARPGALPTVFPAPLARDLERRDFTINALALDLRTEEIVDTMSGATDLSRGLLRVLHERSFEDDPTRLFRGARLSVRIGFALDDHTTDLFTHALKTNAQATVSRERIWREILLAFREPEPDRTLAEFVRRGLLDQFLSLDESAPAPDEILLVGTALREAAGVDPTFAMLGFILAGNKVLVDSLEGTPLRENERKRIAQISASVRSLARDSTLLSDHALFDTAKRLPDEALVVAAALSPADAIRLGRLRDCRHQPIPIDPEAGVGSGRHIGMAIEAARLALFTGEVTRETVTAFARAKALQYLSEQA